MNTKKANDIHKMINEILRLLIDIEECHVVRVLIGILMVLLL